MYNDHGPYSHRRDPGMRAADTDREAIADRLRAAHTEGRLDAEEFQHRVDRCYEAKTIGELDALLTDLPRERQGERLSCAGRTWLRWLVPVFVALIVISALTGGHHGHFGWWILIPLLFFARFWFWPRRWRYSRYSRW